MLPAPIPIPDPPIRLIFVCQGCGLTLSADPQQTGVRGPCPSCGAPVQAPKRAQQRVSSNDEMPEHEISQVDAGTTSSSHRRGGIVADSALDHQHADHRETAKGLWILALFILVIGACLLVTWFLKDWVRE